MEDLSTEESRLIAIHRAIRKFGNPEIVSLQDASLVASYIQEMIDLDIIENVASDIELEYFLDGLILGIALMRLLSEGVPMEELPKPKVEREKQFQTGVDPITNTVNVRKKGQKGQ